MCLNKNKKEITALANIIRYKDWINSAFIRRSVSSNHLFPYFAS